MCKQINAYVIRWISRWLIDDSTNRPLLLRTLIYFFVFIEHPHWWSRQTSKRERERKEYVRCVNWFVRYNFVIDSWSQFRDPDLSFVHRLFCPLCVINVNWIVWRNWIRIIAENLSFIWYITEIVMPHVHLYSGLFSFSLLLFSVCWCYFCRLFAAPFHGGNGLYTNFLLFLDIYRLEICFVLQLKFRLEFSNYDLVYFFFVFVHWLFIICAIADRSLSFIDLFAFHFRFLFFSISSTDRPLDCSEVRCLPCPEDSVTTTQLLVKPDPLDSETLLKKPIAVPIDTDHLANTDELIIKGKSKRAIVPREAIRIVPGGYEFTADRRIRRSAINGQRIQECCAHRQCQCDAQKCLANRPECMTDQVLLLARRANGMPGDCCDEYRCGIEPKCTVANKLTRHPAIVFKADDDNAHAITSEWIVNGASRCKCVDGQRVCDDVATTVATTSAITTTTTPLAMATGTATSTTMTTTIEPPSPTPTTLTITNTTAPATAEATTTSATTEHHITCYSSIYEEHFAVNETWREDECTECVCDKSGTPICTSPVCKPRSCKMIRAPGQCCPVCDEIDNPFCIGHGDCDIVCRYGLEMNHDEGCQLCKCAKMPTEKPQQLPPTTQSPSSPSTPSSSATSSPAPTPQIAASSPQPTESPSSTSSSSLPYPDIDTNIVRNENMNVNLILYLPVLIVICLTIIVFMFVVGLTCKYLHYNKDKYCVNKKMYDNNLTPLI